MSTKLISRRQVKDEFGRSYDTMRRMEARGPLTPTRLNRSMYGHVYYQRSEVEGCSGAAESHARSCK